MRYYMGQVESLKRARKAKGMSLTEVAERSGLHRGALLQALASLRGIRRIRGILRSLFPQ